MSTSIISNTGFKGLLLAAAALLFLTFSIALSATTVATVEEDLRADTTRLEGEIASTETYLAELQAQADTLKKKIEQLDTEIYNESKKIELTENNIKELKLQIIETEKELDRQIGLLKHALVTLYKEGNITTIELLASSDSYTEFVNQQEYLSRIKDQIHDSAKQVEKLKEDLETEKKNQDNLLLKLEAQKEILDGKRSEQQRILEVTKGEEARYQAIAKELHDERAASDARLEAYLRSLASNYVSLGPVAAGDVIGGVGNTGVSTGAHLHFEVRTPELYSPAINPGSVLGTAGWVWPLPGGTVSQYFGGYHNAYDFAGMPEGSPVVAAAAGNIIHRGCIDEGTVWANNMVIIDHGNGYYTRYAHLVAPDDPIYDGCRGNTWPWWY